QMLRDEQTHALPEDAVDRARIADGLGQPDWTALRIALGVHRDVVSEEFAALLAPRPGNHVPGALADYWRKLRDTGGEQPGELALLSDAGFADAASADSLLRDLVRSPGVRGLSDSTSARLDRVLPALLQGAAGSSQPMLALRRLLALLHNIDRKSV